MSILLIHTSFQPYKKRWLNILDTIFLVDIGLFSVYSAISIGTINLSGFNRVIYDAAPFVLILIPSCYLFAVLGALFFNRLFKRLRSTASSKLSRGLSAKNVRRVPTSTMVVVDASQSITSQNILYNVEREPLLADNAAELMPPLWK